MTATEKCDIINWVPPELLYNAHFILSGRARYGTGVFLKLNKRNCEIRIRLTPCNCDVLRVHFRIGGNNHCFYPSGVMGSQFSAFLRAVFCLYDEEDGSHVFYRKYDKNCSVEKSSEDKNKMAVTTKVEWDEEGRFIKIKLIRASEKLTPPLRDEPDPIQIEMDNYYGRYSYTVDGRDLCYAVARGCTEALKKYGFLGYLKSTGGSYLGESFDLNMLLFVKAYALGALGARKTAQAWEDPHGWMRAEASPFEKEVELLMFDM